LIIPKGAILAHQVKLLCIRGDRSPDNLMLQRLLLSLTIVEEPPKSAERMR
jgi:hypothetical protein